VLLLVLAGCGGSAPTGGRDTLPQPLPEGVTFAPVSTTAQAPPFALRLLDGTPVEGSTLWKDRPVVLLFFASWCSRCTAQQDRLRSLVEDYGDVATFVGIGGQDQPGAVRAWMDDHGVTYPVGIDPDQAIWRRYAVRTPPAVVLIAPGGKLLRGWPGGVDTDTLKDELGRLVRR
jgi:peroxiredoxin